MGNKIINKIEVGPIPPKNRNSLWLKPENGVYNIKIYENNVLKNALQEDKKESRMLIISSDHNWDESRMNIQEGKSLNPKWLTVTPENVFYAKDYNGYHYLQWDSFVDVNGFYHKGSDSSEFKFLESQNEIQVWFEARDPNKDDKAGWVSNIIFINNYGVSRVETFIMGWR